MPSIITTPFAIILAVALTSVFSGTVPETNEHDPTPTIINKFPPPSTGLRLLGTFKSSQYHLSTFEANAAEANSYCLQSAYKLLSIETSSEQLNILREISATNIPKNFFWTSGSDMAQEGRFIWTSTERKVLYKNFRNAASNDATRNCIGVHKVDGKWHIISCATENYFICEVE